MAEQYTFGPRKSNTLHPRFRQVPTGETATLDMAAGTRIWSARIPPPDGATRGANRE